MIKRPRECTVDDITDGEGECEGALRSLRVTSVRTVRRFRATTHEQGTHRDLHTARPPLRVLRSLLLLAALPFLRWPQARPRARAQRRPALASLLQSCSFDWAQDERRSSEASAVVVRPIMPVITSKQGYGSSARHDGRKPCTRQAYANHSPSHSSIQER